MAQGAVMIRKLKFAAFAISLLASTQAAFGAIALDGVEGKKHEVKIPATELTRIAIEGIRMRGFKFNLEELEVEQDKDAGTIYVKPLVRNKPISVFVLSTTGATHELVMTPTEGLPLESIVIREPASRTASKAGIKPIEKAGALEVSVKRLVTSMAREELSSPEFSFEKLNVPVVLWRESQFVMVGRFTTRSLIGESYKLMNTSGKLMRVAEQELYKPGVVAVVVESQILRAGEESNVFIVRVNTND
jgi:conjugal transfer pilus assembly protein TraK